MPSPELVLPPAELDQVEDQGDEVPVDIQTLDKLFYLSSVQSKTPDSKLIEYLKRVYNTHEFNIKY